jgi:hypothetical protein
MSSKPNREVAVRLRPRRRVAATGAAALIALLAATPTTSALASADSSGSGAGISTQRRSTLSGRSLASPGELLPTVELETLLSSLPLEDLSATQLAHYLAGLEGINELTKLEMGLLSGKHLGVKGLEETLSKAIEQLGASAKLGELAQVEDLLPALEAALEGKLGGLLSVLLGALPGSGSGVESALGSLNLDQLVGSLLSSTKPEEQLASELSGLAGGLFGELNTEGKLGDLLGSELTGGFVPKNVKEVAEELQSTPKAVSEELGQTATQLPETTTMLTAPLTEGKVVGLAPAVDGLAPAVSGLALGVLGGLNEGNKGEESPGKGTGGEGNGNGSGEGKGTGGSGEGSGKSSGEGNGSGTGGQGGPGGTGSGGSMGGITILLTPPGTSSLQSTPTTAAKHQLGKVSVLSHRTKGRVATIVLKVPAAGKVTLAGKGLRSTSAHPAKAERLTLRVSLSKSGIASLHRSRHHQVPVKLKVSFKPTSGSGSSATVTLSFA